MKTAKPPRRQIRLAIASNAGGSGKTTSAIHLAYLVGVRGYKTVIIELDHNGSLRVLAGIDPEAPSVADILHKDFDGNYPLFSLWNDHVPNVFAIPGGEPMEEVITELYNNARRYYLLGDRLDDYPLEADLIIFDTPASLEPMGLVSLAAATHVLAPIKPEYKDVGALAGLLNWYYEKISELRLKPKPTFLGFVPTRVDLRNEAIHRNLLGLTKDGKLNSKIEQTDTLPHQISSLGIDCFPLVRETSYYLWASSAGLPLHIYRPGLSYAQDYEPIADLLIRLITEED